MSNECEVCGREVMRVIPKCYGPNDTDCYRLGYTRELAAREAAERSLAELQTRVRVVEGANACLGRVVNEKDGDRLALRDRAEAAEKERDEARDRHERLQAAYQGLVRERAAERVANAGLREALGVARKAIDRDKTGLAGGLAKVQRIVGGFRWLGDGEWGSYPWDERTEKTLRSNMAACLDQVNVAAGVALNDSGRLANESVRAIDAVLSAAPPLPMGARRAGIDKVTCDFCREPHYYVDRPTPCRNPASVPPAAAPQESWPHEKWCAIYGNPEAGKSCDCADRAAAPQEQQGAAAHGLPTGVSDAD